MGGWFLLQVKFKGIVNKIHIEKFRKISDQSFELGCKLTAVVGQNGTMKTTILGMLCQPFSMSDKTNPIATSETIDGYKFESKFSDKFKINIKYDTPGNHRWTLHLNDTIQDMKSYYTIESIYRKEKGKPDNIRFWNAEGREVGEGYIQIPVIFLSLKRLLPIGEDTRAKFSKAETTPEEDLFFNKHYNEILVLDEEITETSMVKSSSKRSIVATNKIHGPESISAGQDNISKILTAILSFKRLKDNFPKDYKGGLLLIDEIDATLYPAAQEKLIDKLMRFASDYKIQIIFTTHSAKIIESILVEKYARDNKVVFLNNIGGKVYIKENQKIDQIIADLNIQPIILKRKIIEKVRLYSEDDEARLFLKSILPQKYMKLIQLIKINIGAPELIALTGDRKVPEFKDNLIVLDGDKSTKYKNIVVLPMDNKGPDRLMYDFLKQLDPQDSFWCNDTGGYNKQSCFRDFISINHAEPASRELYKNWFKSQQKYWGPNSRKLFERWKRDHAEEVKHFTDDFIKAYNYVARKKHIELIE